MDAWVWLTAYVVAFGVLQIFLYRHFSRRTATPTEGRVDRTGSGGHTDTDDAEANPCKHCGTVNEAHAMVRYCRECAEPLR